MIILLFLLIGSGLRVLVITKASEIWTLIKSSNTYETETTCLVFSEISLESKLQVIFAPTALVQEILDNFPDTKFLDPTTTFLNPCYGDGQFLSEVIIRKNGTRFLIQTGTR